MGVFAKDCSICSNRAVAEVVNKMLAENAGFKAIAAHFNNKPSKSSIGRHSLNCVKRAADLTFRDGDSAHVVYQTDLHTPETQARIQAAAARVRRPGKLWLAMIRYAEPATATTAKNPSALLSESERARIEAERIAANTIAEEIAIEENLESPAE